MGKVLPDALESAPAHPVLGAQAPSERNLLRFSPPRLSMRVIGLTGGIASGKSTVSAMLRELGAQLIDADQLAREVVEPNTPAFAELNKRFPEVFNPEGQLDRRKLAERVFSDPAERAALNAIVHPRIQQRFAEKVDELARR